MYMYIVCQGLANIHMNRHSFWFIKEGVRAAGANSTKKQREEISLCGMFLLQAGKKADSAFSVLPA